MDQGTLVESLIDGGQQFIHQLVGGGFDVTAAAWVKDAEDGQWRFYVVSTVVDDEPLAVAYRTAYSILRRVPASWITVPDVKLVGTRDPVARNLLEILTRYPGPLPVRARINRLGEMAVEEVYLYPPVRPPSDKWRGISVMVFADVDRPGVYRVEFWPHQLQMALTSGGPANRVPNPARVELEGDPATGFRVVSFQPPEQMLAGLEQRDYVEKAFEAIATTAAKSAKQSPV